MYIYIDLNFLKLFILIKNYHLKLFIFKLINKEMKFLLLKTKHLTETNILAEF